MKVRARAKMLVRLVAVNEYGQRIGQDHQRAVLSDAEVELMRQLAEEGMAYSELARKFEVSKWTVGRICRYERRAQTPVRFKQVHIGDEGQG